MEPLPIYLQMIHCDAQTLYGLSFRKNPALYHWLKRFQFVCVMKTTGQLTLPADDGYIELIEIAAKGRLTFKRSRLQKEVIKKGVAKETEQLNRIEIPKHKPSIRVQLKLAEIESQSVFLLRTETVLDAKKYLLSIPFIHYSKRLCAFILNEKKSC